MFDVKKTVESFAKNGLENFGPRGRGDMPGPPPEARPARASTESRAETALPAPVALPAEMVEVTSRFKKEYAPAELAELWGTLLYVYGDEAAAVAAVQSNWQMLCPSYTYPPVLLESKAALLEMMDDASVASVMADNPAVLQCGAKLTEGGEAAAEGIESFAKFRGATNSLIPEEARAPLIVAALAGVLWNVVVKFGSGDFGINNLA